MDIEFLRSILHLLYLLLDTQDGHDLAAEETENTVNHTQSGTVFHNTSYWSSEERAMLESHDCTEDQYIECIGGAYRRYIAVPPENLEELLMATAFTVPPDTKRLIDTNNTPVQSQANPSTSNKVHKNRSIAVTLKSIELFVTIVTLWMVNDHEVLILDSSTQFIFATLGAFIILPVFVMAGLIVGEVSPRLLVWLNCLGALHFSALAALLFYRDQLEASTTFLSILTALLYIIDARVSSRALPLKEEHRRYVRYTHG